MMKKIKRYLIYGVILSILGGIIIFSYNWSSNKSIKSIRFIGLISISDKDLIKFIDSSVYKTPKSKLKLASIRDSLLKNRMVDSCIITTNFDDELIVEITEKKPLANFLTDKSSFFINKNGDSLSNSIAKFYPDLPIIRLNSLANSIDSSKYLKLINFLNSQSLSNIEKISEITFENNEIIVFLVFLGIKVNLGYFENSNQNFTKLIEFLDKKKDLNFSKINYIDTRWINRVIVSELN